MALLDHITATSARAAAQVRSPAAPSLDPVTMLVGLAAIGGNLHPPSSGAGEQLRALATIAEQSAQNSPALPATPPATPVPATPPTMVWAVIPGVGPALMRLDQARKLALRGAPPPSSPPPSPDRSVAVETAQPRAWSWNDVALRLKDPAEQLAFKAALERAVAAQATASAAPTRVARMPAPSHEPTPALAPIQAVPTRAPVFSSPRPAPLPSPTAAPATPMPPAPAVSAAQAAHPAPDAKPSAPRDATITRPADAEPPRGTSVAPSSPPLATQASPAQWTAALSAALARSRPGSFPPDALPSTSHVHHRAYPRASPLLATSP